MKFIYSLTSFLAVANAASHGIPNCVELSTTFGSALHYPDNDNFTIWDAKQQEVRPACRIEPSNAADVAKVLDTLVNHWCEFAVKGGGHSRNPGDSNSIGGVTVDLDRIRQIEISQDGSRARVGGGATTVQVYRALESRNLSFVGGRVGSVGVGGFTLGGGTSPFSNKFGWALDNVFEYEVVLANGTITTASETLNPDLYFALRGGSNNFGIVTAFTVRTFEQGPVFNAIVSYSNNQSEQVLDRVYELFTREDLIDDADMGLDMYYSYSSQTGSFGLTGSQRYAKPVENPPVFREIDEIPPVSRRVTIDTMSSLVGGAGEMGTTRHLFATLSTFPSRSLLTKALRIFREEVEAILPIPGLVPDIICYPLQRNAIAAMRQRGGNALGIEGDSPIFIILVSTAWSNAEDDVAVNTMTQNVIDRLKGVAQDLNVENRYLYINYASAAQTGEVFAGYGEENVRRLKNIQRSVDSREIFTSQGLWKGFVKLI